MIITFLVVLIVTLIIANILITANDKKDYYHTQHENWNKSIEKITQPVQNNENFIEKGKSIANEQKINILTQRISGLERVVFSLAEKKPEEKEIDFEKIDFRIKVLENEIDKIKNPKNIGKTFYGQKNDPMEETIKSLVFNSRKKN